MHIIIIGILISFAILISMILALAAGAKRLQRISGYIMAPAAVLGLFFYCGAYLSAAQTVQEMAAAVFRGVYTTLTMFMGRADYSSVINSAPWFAQSRFLQAVFWFSHLSAFFVTASALLSTLGRKLLQTLRIIFLRPQTVYIYFGLHEQSIALGRDIARGKNRKGKHIYISPKDPAGLHEQVLGFGGIVRQELYLTEGSINENLMKILNVKKSCVYILALDDSESVNIDIAAAAINYFKKEKIPPEKTKIMIKSMGELDYSQMDQFAQDEIVYNVESFSEAELAARLLVNDSPPYKCIKFNSDGTAAEDFLALIIGFGQVGQQALRHIVMNSQFEGSKFCAIVVEKNAKNLAGQFAHRYLGMDREYDIQYHSVDDRSHEYYKLLDEIAHKVKYIVVALGSDDANYEATADLERYFTRLGKKEHPKILVNVCNKRFIAKTKENIRFIDRRQALYSSDLLIRNTLDKMAEAVNYTYRQAAVWPPVENNSSPARPKGSYVESKEGALDPQSEWNRLDYFSRESCRASAAFIPAMLHIAGITEEEARDKTILEKKIPKGSALMELLGKNEHLRWNAFHYAMGYTVMPLQEVRERAASGIKPIQKDTQHLRHACLVSWDELDKVSEVVSELTGKKIDYKEYDRVNIYNISRTLSFAN